MNYDIFRKIREAGGHALVIGGWCRDQLLGFESKDVDVEVFGLEEPQLKTLLSSMFGKDLEVVGESFGVFKTSKYDFSLPRREVKTGKGHKGFETVADPHMTIKEAASRRDFTINTISFDPLTEIYHDFWGGMDDLHFGVLRHTSPAFAEDPLRVMRGFQFISRFGLSPTQPTIELCKTLRDEFHTLPKERILEEFKKWAKGKHPGKALDFLLTCGWLECFPDLYRLAGCPQDPIWHPEGDVWNHTKHVCDWAAKLGGGFPLMMGALLHDVGKPACTTESRKFDSTISQFTTRIISPGHDSIGASIAEQFLLDLKCDKKTIKAVKELVANHMCHLGKNSARKARRLIHKNISVENLDLLWKLMEADHCGRPPLPRVMPEAALELKALVEVELDKDAEPKPLVMGRDLLERGFKAGPEMGKVLKDLYELQINEGFSKDRLLEEV